MTSTVMHKTNFLGALAIPLLLFTTGASHGQGPGPKRDGFVSRYLIVELPGIDGETSAGSGVGKLATVAGWSNVPDEGTRHAAAWFLGQRRDLGTLGGPNSTVIWPGSVGSGMVVGFSETGELDVNEEEWSCSAFFPPDPPDEPSFHVCRGFAYFGGEMRPMPTLGGTHSVAVGVNDQGQVVGWAETDLEDPSCGPDCTNCGPDDRNQQLQFLPVVWKPRTGEIQELPPFGDCDEGTCTTGTANAINNQGQVVGISGECDRAVGRASAKYAVMWEDGVPKDLGNIGGETWNTPTAINEAGQVVGFANFTPGPALNEKGFMWTEEDGMQPLEPLENDVQSQAWGINERSQVVGVSQGPNGNTAVLWQDGETINLNDCVAFGYDKQLTVASDISDLGVITGETEEGVAFWGIPVPGRCNPGRN